MKIILIVLSIILDVLFSNIFNFNLYKIPYFYPMLSIAVLVYLSNFYNNPNRKNYYVLAFIMALIYDSLITNNILITALIFELIAILNIKIKTLFTNNLMNNILRLIISIFVYDLAFFIFLNFIGIQSFDLSLLLYKFIHSLFINIVYISLMFLVLKDKKGNKI